MDDLLGEVKVSSNSNPFGGGDDDDDDDNTHRQNNGSSSSYAIDIEANGDSEVKKKGSKKGKKLSKKKGKKRSKKDGDGAVTDNEDEEGRSGRYEDGDIENPSYPEVV